MDEEVIVDIQVDSKEVILAEKNVDKLTDSIEELGNRITDARKQNKEYKKQQTELNKLYKEGKISSNQYEKGVDGLNKKINTNNKVIAKTQVALSKQRGERTANIKLINAEKNSLAQLQAEATLLNKAITDQSTATKEGREEYEKLSKKLGVTNELINEQRQAFNDNTKNIGNYKDSLKGAESGTDSLSKSFKALLANPVVLIISLIVAGLAALFGAFKKSENGAKLLEKAGAALNGLMMILTRVMNTLANALTKAFEDPQQAVKDLWEAIKTNLVNRVEGLIRLFKALINIDFSNLKKSAKEVGSAFIQVSTGLDEDQQKRITENFAEMAKEAAILAKKMVDLAASQRALRAQSRGLEKEIAILNAEFERLGEIAGDDTRNMEEMRRAAINAGNAAAELAQKQVKLAQIRLNTISQEVAVRRSAGEDIQDLLDRQADAEVALTEAKSKSALAQQKILIEQRKIERDIFEQNLDILLDVGDKIKTEQEKAIQNESLSLEKRKQLLEASRVALNANFDEIKKEYELYGVTAEQINDIINSSDAKQANEKLKALGINEIAVNRLREIILERKQAELDFNDIANDLAEQEKKRSEESVALAKKESDEKEEIRIEDLEKQKDELKEFFDDIADITGEFAGNELAIFGRIASGIVDAFEDGKVTIESALQSIGMVSRAVFDNIAESRAEDLHNNEKARKAELELVGADEEAKAAINEEFDKKSAILKLKQFNADKARALTDIAIATAVGATKALPNLILAGIVTAFGLTQGILVGTKKPPNFGKGVNDIVNIGDSHASGNDVDVFGVSGNQKQYFGKVEKGEAMPVIRKSAVNDYMVSQLNGKYSPKVRSFAGGTDDITNQGQTQNNEIFVNQLVGAIQDIRIVAKIEDITKEAARKVEIIDNSKV